MSRFDDTPTAENIIDAAVDWLILESGFAPEVGGSFYLDQNTYGAEFSIGDDSYEIQVVRKPGGNR